MAQTAPVGQRRAARDHERVEVRIGTGTPRRFVYDEDGRLIGEYGNMVASGVCVAAKETGSRVKPGMTKP